MELVHLLNFLIKDELFSLLQDVGLALEYLNFLLVATSEVVLLEVHPRLNPHLLEDLVHDLVVVQWVGGVLVDLHQHLYLPELLKLILEFVLVEFLQQFVPVYDRLQ